MNVTFFARVDIKLNPYLLLYKTALENQGIQVHMERVFGWKWLLTHKESCDAIHLHWVEGTYKPNTINSKSFLINKLLENRFSTALRAALRLLNFSTALLVAKLQGKRIVYTVHNLKEKSTYRPYVHLNRWAHHVLMALVDQIHAHNNYTRRTLDRLYHRKTGVSVIPIGNYIGHYPNEISKTEARQRLNLSDEAFVYLFIGLLRPHKGVEDLIQAFKALEPDRKQLVIVGKPASIEYREKIVELIQQHPNIKLIPEFVPDEDLQIYMNACDICVLPYKDITTSSAALLAFSFGRPLIAPAITSFPDVVTPETGILYDPDGNPSSDRDNENSALTLALQQAENTLWSETQVFKHAHQFDWEDLGPRLAALYRRKKGEPEA